MGLSRVINASRKYHVTELVETVAAMGGGASKGKAAVTAVVFQNRIRKALRFFDADALLASVESGAIALLSGRFLVQLHQRGQKLQRRQDLPPEAFLGITRLRNLVANLGHQWGRLLVAISYRWLTADHPDPDGFHLAIIARVAELYLKRAYHCGHCSPLVAAFDSAGLDEAAADFGVLWDFGSLFQKPRTDAETLLFKQGLRALPM